MTLRAVGLILVLNALLVASVLAGQNDPFRISVDVDTVTIDAIVQEQSGRAVTDLTRNDFEILENGRPQEIVYFASTDAPRSVLLLFDFSLSTETQRGFMSDAFGVLLKRMRPQDRIALASFASQFQMLMEWRNVAGKPVDVLAPAPQAGSDFFRALERAIGSFKKEKDRKAIIVMTDGRDTSMFDDVVRLGKIVAVDADKDFQKLLKSVAKQSIPTYFIAMNTDRNRDSTALDFEHGALEGASGRAFADNYLVAVRSRMERLAEATGGKVLYPKTIADVVPLYDAVGRDLGYSYSMGYSSNNKSNDGKPRRIEVRVRKNGLKVTQSRDSYTR